MVVEWWTMLVSDLISVQFSNGLATHNLAAARAESGRDNDHNVLTRQLAKVQGLGGRVDLDADIRDLSSDLNLTGRSEGDDSGVSGLGGGGDGGCDDGGCERERG